MIAPSLFKPLQKFDPKHGERNGGERSWEEWYWILCYYCYYCYYCLPSLRLSLPLTIFTTGLTILYSRSSCTATATSSSWLCGSRTSATHHFDWQRCRRSFLQNQVSRDKDELQHHHLHHHLHPFSSCRTVTLVGVKWGLTSYGAWHLVPRQAIYYGRYFKVP